MIVYGEVLQIFRRFLNFHILLSIRLETGSRTDAWNWRGRFRTVWLTCVRRRWRLIWCITLSCTVSDPLRIPAITPGCRRARQRTLSVLRLSTTVLLQRLYPWTLCISTAPFRVYPSIPVTRPWWHRTSLTTPSTSTHSEREDATGVLFTFVNTGWSAILDVNPFSNRDARFYLNVCKSWENVFHSCLFVREDCIINHFLFDYTSDELFYFTIQNYFRTLFGVIS